MNNYDWLEINNPETGITHHDCHVGNITMRVLKMLGIGGYIGIFITPEGDYFLHGNVGKKLNSAKRKCQKIFETEY